MSSAVPARWRGASRSSRVLGAECDGRGRALDETRERGRRSRVVLMPRRWHQLGDDVGALRGDDASHRTEVLSPSHHTGDGGNKARSPGRARSKPLKPLRREGRMIRSHLWRLHPCAFLLRTGLRVRRAPGLPCALCIRGARASRITRTRQRRGKADVCFYWRRREERSDEQQTSVSSFRTARSDDPESRDWRMSFPAASRRSSQQ
jgi:hypothetical protein